MSEFKNYNPSNLAPSVGKVSRPPACSFCKEKKYKCDRNDNEGIYKCLQCKNRNLNCEISKK